ncbi:MAG TPA: hypothetical protein VK681_39295 [Reyranella sp.]|nr:hypothetical protein [Reyranella sp.]
MRFARLTLLFLALLFVIAIPVVAFAAVVAQADSTVIHVASGVTFAVLWAKLAAPLGALLTSGILWFFNKVIQWRLIAEMSAGAKTTLYLIIGGIAATLLPGIPADAAQWGGQTAYGVGSAVIVWLGFKIGHNTASPAPKS